MCYHFGMGKRGLARDRLSDPEARVIRKILRTARRLIEVTNEDIATQTGWTLQRVVHTFAAGRPLRRANAEILLQAIRELRPRHLKRRDGGSGALDALLTTIDPAPIVPPALIPVATIPEMAAYIAAEISRPGRSIGPKRRKVLASQLEHALKTSAEAMARQAYQMNRGGRWITDENAAALLRGFGFTVPTAPGFVRKRNQKK